MPGRRLARGHGDARLRARRLDPRPADELQERAERSSRPRAATGCPRCAHPSAPCDAHIGLKLMRYSALRMLLDCPGGAPFQRGLTTRSSGPAGARSSVNSPPTCSDPRARSLPRRPTSGDLCPRCSWAHARTHLRRHQPDPAQSHRRAGARTARAARRLVTLHRQDSLRAPAPATAYRERNLLAGKTVPGDCGRRHRRSASTTARRCIEEGSGRGVLERCARAPPRPRRPRSYSAPGRAETGRRGVCDVTREERRRGAGTRGRHRSRSAISMWLV